MTFAGRLRMIQALSRNARVAIRRQAHGHHEAVNPGPPITLDYMPVPCQPYGVVHGELQRKFNTYLAISGTFAVVSLIVAFYDDVFAWDSLTPPESYRKKQPGVLAK